MNAPDHELSPWTGWTRSDWETIADQWLLRLRAYPEDLPGRPGKGGQASDRYETFARSIVLAACRVAASDDPHGHAQWYAEGLARGVRTWPRGLGRGEVGEGNGQPIVETAILAMGLDISRSVIWDQLPAVVQEQLVEFLTYHAQRPVSESNWLLFPAAAEAFLASVGADVSGCDNAAGVERLEQWYAGDGWYTDGPARNVDHYNAFVIHPFLGMWYRHRGSPSALAAWRSRLASFVERYSALFAPDGSPLIQGRSLTYRCAVLAPLWVASSEGVSPLAPGETRRIASSVLRHFVSAGVGSDGPLSMGWHHAYPPAVQAYSGPGSPYYAALGFLGLAQPASSPVWTDVEVLTPPPGEVALPGIGWLAHAADGVVRVVNAGSDHYAGAPEDNPLYAKMSYSTHAAPGLDSAADDAIDNHFAILSPDGQPSWRAPIRDHLVRGNLAASLSLVSDSPVVSASLVRGRYELRCHLVDLAESAPVREGGFALASPSVVPAAASPEVAYARLPSGLVAAVLPVHGWTGTGIARYKGASMLGTHSAVPFVTGTHTGGRAVYVALHVLGRPPGTPDTWGVRSWVDGTVVSVEWPCGRRDTVDLASLF